MQQAHSDETRPAQAEAGFRDGQAGSDTPLFIVTLDGPAGVGKTTLAKLVADALGIAYLDTGAMFRTLALRLGPGIADCPEDEIRSRAGALAFSLQGKGAGTRLLCNNVPVGEEIRTEEVGQMASCLASVPVVREILKKVQRDMGRQTPLVAEGRDMGTVVFPTARFKFFLDASPEVRARRRLGDLKAMGKPVVTLAELETQIRIRDERDRTRAVAPLRAAEDAYCIDTSSLTQEEVLAAILHSIQDLDGKDRAPHGGKEAPVPGGFLRTTRERGPLVHFITNMVTVNDCANMTIAAGGSPIMADAPEEVAQVTALCRALVINTGTITQRTALSMLVAGKAARAAGHVIVLDPVGAGVSDLRNETLHKLVREARPDVIKGNISEIRFLACGTGSAQGVDAARGDLTDESNLLAHARMAGTLAASLGCVVVVSGAIDIVAGAGRAYAIRNGSAWMGRVSGTGCMAAAVLGAFVGASPDRPLEAALAAMTAMGVSGEKAQARMTPETGTGSYRQFLLDAMSLLTEGQLDAMARIRVLF